MTDFFNTLIAHSGEFALLALFLLVLAESTALVGLLVPGTALMVAMGTLVGNGTINFWHACAVGFVAALLGDGLSYWLGRRYRHKLHRLELLKPHRRLLIRARFVLRHNGPAGIFAGRFIGPTRPVLPMVAGMLSMPQRRFLPACVLACLLWTPVYLMPGVFAGAAFALAGEHWLPFPAILISSAVLLVIAGVLLAHVIRRWRATHPMTLALRLGTPVSVIASAVLGWLLVTHPQAAAYGGRLWQVIGTPPV
ncbi:DedA family protein [Chitinibacteraceae bacterium HSL-7]